MEEDKNEIEKVTLNVWRRIYEMQAHKEFVDILLEYGIDYNKDTKTVKFNSKHEKGVDTSIESNPTEHEVFGHPVISIFKRNKTDDKGDGNPLIYALKGMKDWKIDEESLIGLFKNFVRISEKIKEKYDTIVVVGSSSDLNGQFAKRINKVIKADNVIDGIFGKLTVDEVAMDFYDPSKLSPEEIKQTFKMFDKMRKENKGIFSYKFLPKNLRKAINTSVKWNPSNSVLEYEQQINDKDILILDDTITSGKTISDYCEAILETFKPKSITILTLFSPLEN